MNKKHNEAIRGEETKEYMAWLNMKARCSNENRPDYHRYGGRGITVCARWAVYEHFLADMGRATPIQSLERRDNNRGYCPENCLWATKRQQANNRRSNRLITIRGSTLTIAKWAEIKGVPARMIHVRILRGWDPVDAIMTPKGPRHRPSGKGIRPWL